MQLICLSISHHHTPLGLRECLSLSPAVVAERHARQPIREAEFEPILEMALLSTCNRLEVYALVSLTDDAVESPARVIQPVMNYLERVFEVPVQQMRPYFRSYLGGQVVEHLFQVAAGLDSIAIGETQILGQVSRALDAALHIGSARHVLSSLFRSAIHAGKRVRSETDLGRHPTSISAIAVQLAEDTLGSLEQRRILVVGTGEMGGSVVAALRERGAAQLTLVNRTTQRAMGLAGGVGAAVLPYERLTAGLAAADLVFTCTSAPQPILGRDEVGAMMAQRAGRPLVLVDLAVPRNVEPVVEKLAGVKLFDMDDFQSYVKVAEVSSHPEIAQAKSIVAAEVAEYEKLLQVIPFIGELHRKVEQIRQREVERALRNLRDADPQVSEQIELFSRALVRKILHEPTMHLRSEASQETLNEYVGTLIRLFDLSEVEANISLQNGG